MALDNTDNDRLRDLYNRRATFTRSEEWVELHNLVVRRVCHSKGAWRIRPEVREAAAHDYFLDKVFTPGPERGRDDQIASGNVLVFYYGHYLIDQWRRFEKHMMSIEDGSGIEHLSGQDESGQEEKLASGFDPKWFVNPSEDSEESSDVGENNEVEETTEEEEGEDEEEINTVPDTQSESPYSNRLYKVAADSFFSKLPRWAQLYLALTDCPSDDKSIARCALRKAYGHEIPSYATKALELGVGFPQGKADPGRWAKETLIGRWMTEDLKLNWQTDRDEMLKALKMLCARALKEVEALYADYRHHAERKAP